MVVKLPGQSVTRFIAARVRTTQYRPKSHYVCVYSLFTLPPCTNFP